MATIPVIAIFDIGKTHKKWVLFDQDYNLIREEEITIPLIADEDGFPCDDLQAHTSWLRSCVDTLMAKKSWSLKALNFASFGASFVHIDKQGNPLTPLYNYLKPIDLETSRTFYDLFGDKYSFSDQTGSPALNMLNSGLQLFWLKKKKPSLFDRIHCSLHLPQFLSYLFTGACRADTTSIGCHTGIWDMHRKAYHQWLSKEHIAHVLPEASSCNTSHAINYKGNTIITGIGLHDSSASLLPFTLTATDTIAILSTGTWNITFVPSFKRKLTKENYERDCLYYLLDKDQPVAASRVFLGNEFEYQLKKINAWYQKPDNYYQSVSGNSRMLQKLIEKNSYATTFVPETMQDSGPYPALKGNGVALSCFRSFEEAYHKLVLDCAWLQKESIDLLLKDSLVKKIYVTGGFSKNRLFMDLLQNFLPHIRFYTSSITNGTALGAALAIHSSWNKDPLQAHLAKTEEHKAILQLDVATYKFAGGNFGSH